MAEGFFDPPCITPSKHDPHKIGGGIHDIGGEIEIILCHA